jgi:multiple sugar transport system permease protein
MAAVETRLGGNTGPAPGAKSLHAIEREQAMLMALRVIGLIFVFAMAVLFLFPLYWMITGSLKGPISTLKVPPELIPTAPTLLNYQQLFTRFPAWRWMLNSCLVAGAATLLSLLISSMSGYAFGKKQFFGKRVLFVVLLSTMMMPQQVILIPLFLQMKRLGMMNSYAGMVLPLVAWPFGMFLIRQLMRSTPNELIDAARIDGASEIGIFRRIILPLSKPALGALGIFTFMQAWNDYLWQLIIINDSRMLTLPVAISTVTRAENFANLGLMMTGATFAFIPMFIIFMLFQDYFVKGLTVGAVKG